MKKTAAIRDFLWANAKPELAALYNHDMEVQVNVAQDGGERVSGEYQGHHWNGWSDGTTMWKSFRIPWQANSDPVYKDRELRFSTQRIEAIGMTGWDWKERVSRWVGYDFDSMVGHVKGLTPAELDGIRARVEALEYVTIHRSKGGMGFHLYVHLDPVIPTENHTVHAALARAVMSKISADVGVNLFLSVDKLGGNLWVWHRDAQRNGFTKIKDGVPLTSVPENWRDHVEVIDGKRHRVRPLISHEDSEVPIEDLSSRQRHVNLDGDHMTLLKWLEDNQYAIVWDSDRNMLVTHTAALRAAHEALELRGIFYTDAKGGDKLDKNCFAFPLRAGAWAVRRFGLNTQEHAAWQRDSAGWTRCLFNHPAELAAAAAAHDGLENAKGNFVFKSLLKAMAALKDLGMPTFELDPVIQMREAILSPIRDSTGKLLLRVRRQGSDNALEGWLQSNRPKGEFWEKVVVIEGRYEEPEPPDWVVRHAITESQDAGWCILTQNGWTWEPRQNVVTVLRSMGHAGKDVDKLVGLAIVNPWILVSIPFEDEYPGGRRWNRNAAQLVTTPREGPHPTWDLIINHCFKGLDVSSDEWCKKYGINTGGEYGLCWTAAMFQHPYKPLPYLFFVGPQNSGKSSFWEGLQRLFANPRRGCVKADNALRSRDGFNMELQGAILAVIEEISLRRNEEAYNRIKDLVTGRTFTLHEKHRTPIDVPNTLHFIQCANKPDFCPVEVGDTRIVMTYVDCPEEEIPKDVLMARLDEEAAAFLYTILHLELPPTPGRLRIPVIETTLKEDQAESNRNELEEFIADHCYAIPGAAVMISHFYEKFFDWLPLDRHQFWNRRVVKRKLPAEHPTGRYTGQGQIHIGNLSFEEVEPGKRLVRKGDRLA